MFANIAASETPIGVLGDENEQHIKVQRFAF